MFLTYFNMIQHKWISNRCNGRATSWLNWGVNTTGNQGRSVSLCTEIKVSPWRCYKLGRSVGMLPQKMFQISSYSVYGENAENSDAMKGVNLRVKGETSNLWMGKYTNKMRTIKSSRFNDKNAFCNLIFSRFQLYARA